MKAFVPKKFEPYAFGLLLSGMMSFIVSGLSVFLTVGDLTALLSNWPHAWISSWLIAFPAVLVVAPDVRRIIAQIVKAE